LRGTEWAQESSGAPRISWKTRREKGPVTTPINEIDRQIVFQFVRRFTSVQAVKERLEIGARKKSLDGWKVEDLLEKGNLV